MPEQRSTLAERLSRLDEDPICPVYLPLVGCADQMKYFPSRWTVEMQELRIGREYYGGISAVELGLVK